MKLNPFHHCRKTAEAQSPKPLPVVSVPPRSSAEPQPRVWSLLLPPGYTRDRH
jgi:hypothetical protein